MQRAAAAGANAPGESSNGDPPAKSSSGDAQPTIGAGLGPALPDQIVILHTICGARRIEVVGEPWLAPPGFLDVGTVKKSVIQVPGQEAGHETRRFDYVQSCRDAALGLVVHLYKERF